MNNKVKFLRGTSSEYAVAEKDSDTIYFTTDDGKLYIGDKEVSGDGSVTIDDTLSDTSTNPVQNKVVKQAIDNKADKILYGDTTINVGRKAGTTVGDYSTAEGYNTTASGYTSHAEGDNTTASAYASHAEGSQTTASGSYSHAEGEGTTAITSSSHAEGCHTTASGSSSHAEGYHTTASGNYSHAGGRYTKALHDNEAAYGKYNESNDDTLFSIGDGTADDARHNAFEITTNGGKMHDKDIATTDLIPDLSPYAKTADVPNIKVNEAVNADTVDNLHADDFVNATDRDQIQIPHNVDVPVWIHTNGKRFQRYMTNSVNVGLTNVPNNSIDYVWYWYDGMNIIAREWATGKYFICDMINDAFSGWKDVYTSGFKPYVKGEATVDGNRICVSNHGFTPSAVLWWDGTYSGVSVSFNEKQFAIEQGKGSYSRRIFYLIFK